MRPNHSKQPIGKMALLTNSLPILVIKSFTVSPRKSRLYCEIRHSFIHSASHAVVLFAVVIQQMLISSKMNGYRFGRIYAADNNTINPFTFQDTFSGTRFFSLDNSLTFPGFLDKRSPCYNRPGLCCRQTEVLTGHTSYDSGGVLCRNYSQTIYNISIIQTAVTVHHCLNGLAPAYLTELCTPITQSRSSCRLRSSYLNRLAVPSVKLSIGSRSFSVSGPTVWNALPDYLRNPTLSIDVYKRYLKTFLFAQY